MDFATRVNEVKKAFEEVGIDEQRYWELVEMANWPNLDYEFVKINYLQNVEPSECKKFRKMTSKLFGILDKFIGNRNPAGGGDDSHSDFIYHIIGLGKETYYSNLENYGLLEDRGFRDDYEESFSYCIPYEKELENPERAIAESQESIESRKRSAQRRDSGDEFKRFSELIEDIAEALGEADGEYIAEVYNKICSQQIEYHEDSLWKVQKSS